MNPPTAFPAWLIRFPRNSTGSYHSNNNGHVAGYYSVAAVTAAGENTVTTGIRPAKQSTPGLLRRHTLESVVSRAPEFLQEHVTGAKKTGLYCWNAQRHGMSRLPLSELLEVSKNQDLPVFCG